MGSFAGNYSGRGFGKSLKGNDARVLSTETTVFLEGN